MTSPYDNKESLASSSTWHQTGQASPSSASRQSSTSTQQPLHPVPGDGSNEFQYDVALFEAQRQNRMMAWQQQQQLISPGTATPSHFDFGTASASAPVVAAAATATTPELKKMASSGQYPPQQPSSQQSSGMPSHLYSMPSSSLASAAFAPMPLQYPQQTAQSSYYPIQHHQQQQQQLHQQYSQQPDHPHPQHQMQHPYGSAPSNYSNYPSQSLSQFPIQSTASPLPSSLSSSWIEPFPSEAAGFYHDQNPSMTPVQTSPLISPSQRSRQQMMGRQSPSTSSPPKSGGSGSGGAATGATSSGIYAMQTPSDEGGGGIRWAVPASQRGGAGAGAGVNVYPSGLVYHRGSYSTMSSGGSTSRSSSMSIPMSSHHFSAPPPPPHPNLTSYFDPSLGTISMPPPNPPPEVRLPLEQESQRRAATACNFCRARKLRCDGNAPCRQCARRDIECVFSQPNPSKRKRKQGDDDDNNDNSATRKDSGSDDPKSSATFNQDRRRSSTSHEIGSSTVKRRSSSQNQANLRTSLLSISASQQNKDNSASLQEEEDSSSRNSCKSQVMRHQEDIVSVV